MRRANRTVHTAKIAPSEALLKSYPKIDYVMRAEVREGDEIIAIHERGYWALRVHFAILDIVDLANAAWEPEYRAKYLRSIGVRS